MEKTAILRDNAQPSGGWNWDFDLIDYVHKELKLERDQVARLGSDPSMKPASRGIPHARRLTGSPLTSAV